MRSYFGRFSDRMTAAAAASRDTLFDLVFPATCRLCDRPVGRADDFCRPCETALTLTEAGQRLACRRCGRVIEFDTPLVGRIRRELGEQKGVSVITAHLHLSGLCADCRHTEEADEDEA